MEPAASPDDRAIERHEIGGSRVGCLTNAIEPLEVDAERKKMDLSTGPGGALAQLLGRHEDEIRLLEQAQLAPGNPPGARRTRGEIVNAVIDGQAGVDSGDEVERDWRRQECPDDRPVESRCTHPAAERARQ